MKRLIYLLFIAFIAISCSSKDEPVDGQYNTYIDASFDFKIETKSGKNLLATGDTLSLSYDDIDVIYFEDGKEKIYSNPMLTASKGFLLNSTYIRLYLNMPDANNESITYLRIGENQLDTIKASFKTSDSETNGNYIGNSTVVQKIWYNSSLVFDRTVSEPTGLPIIIK